MRPELVQKLEALQKAFRDKRRVLIALSGGVDSTLLQEVAHLTLGFDNAIAVTAKSETLTAEEFAAVCNLARERGWNHRVIEYSELEIPNYATNPVNRCYFCKSELFSRLSKLAAENGCSVVVEGTNADDRGDYRPGMMAGREHGVWAPLLELGVTKAEVRELARQLGLATWDKPSGACLSSRVPYGETITREKLEQIAQGEKFLRELGFSQVRVRHHGTVARIELLPEEMPRMFSNGLASKVAERFRALGFVFTALDLIGYRTGSLNALLPGQTVNNLPPGARSDAR
ncbi:MAG: ATP-dependent sacrificial sulfur transferase LarE [Candidatus Sumerlaeaceae bacterium]|nr:ATP-dependent sacrificial sulfur transferase LarE [Candidatus Sumerlaeaceae bacterium]